LSVLHKAKFVEHLLTHNILEPIVRDGLLHSALETSLTIENSVPWYSYCYNSNITIKNFTL